jgi:hypothetical protein
MRKAPEYTGAFHPPMLRTVAIVAVLTLACVPVCLLEVSPALTDSPHPATFQTAYSSHIALIQPGPANTWKGVRTPFEYGPFGAAALAFGFPLNTLHTPCSTGHVRNTCGSRSVVLLKRQLQV